MDASATGSLHKGPDSLLLANYIAGDEAAAQGMPEWRAVITHRHTYVETAVAGPWLLFDDRADPFQMENLIGRERSGGVEESLRGKLREWLIRTHDPFPNGTGLLEAFGLTAAWRERERLMGHQETAERTIRPY